MLSPTGCSEENTTHNNNNLNGLSSSSTSSSPSPFYTNNNNNAQKPKTMEEVWKDINLASLHDHPPSDHNPNFILQDFFARPFPKDSPTRLLSSNNNTTPASTTSTTNNRVLYSSTVASPLLPPPPPPATVLSLNSGPAGFDFLENSDPLIVRPIINSHLGTHHNNHNHLRVSCFSNGNNSPFEGFDSSSSGLLSFGKKRVQESDNSSSDRRHKRMIKNRESAARSRARKQAYTTELELAVKHLQEENARLKRQQEELYLVAAAQLPKKHILHRTLTAPF